MQNVTFINLVESLVLILNAKMTFDKYFSVQVVLISFIHSCSTGLLKEDLKLPIKSELFSSVNFNWRCFYL